MDTNSRNWYTKTKLGRGTENWPLIVNGFELTFNFESEYPVLAPQNVPSILGGAS